MAIFKRVGLRTAAVFMVALATMFVSVTPAHADHEVRLLEATMTGSDVDVYVQFYSRTYVEYDVYVRDTACDQKSAKGYVNIDLGIRWLQTKVYENGQGCNTLRFWGSVPVSDSSGLFSIQISACVGNSWGNSCDSSSAKYVNPHF